jgi:hypothetical protein
MSGIKVIVSGHIIEVYEYEKIEPPTEEKKKKDKPEKADRTEENLKQTSHRARESLRRLIISNFDDKDLFITFTFKENIKDNETANKEFKKFIQRIKHMCSKSKHDFKYVAVIEYQMKNNRGAVHYHMICNLSLDMIPGVLLDGWEKYHDKENKFREKYWKNGWVNIKEINGCDNVGAYLLKYLSKDFTKLHQENKKRYLHSANLNKPHVLEGEYIQDVLKTLEGYYPVFANAYETFYQGQVKYREYNLLRGCKENCI